MYAGAITDAAPTPIPPMNRHMLKSHWVNENPEPIAEMKNRLAANTMTRTRPKRLARPPATQAPRAHPSRTTDTANPAINGPRL
jgi:hypothetical protein